ncbi:MAG: hypothetical protein ACRDK9_08375 [Solirubrobacterales bacterium]
MGERLVIPERYRGFEDVAHGGYVAGLLTRSIDGAAEVVLRRPPPLGRPLVIEPNGDTGGVALCDGESVIAEATPAALELDVPRVVTFDEAQEASKAYPGHTAHPFPSCFACGPHRQRGDGLRLFPGRLNGSRIVAAPFEPGALADGSEFLGSELAWAAVDCPQLWALMMDAPPDSPERVVTSRLAGTVRDRIRANQRYVVMAWPAGRDGDRLHADAAIVSEEGEPIGVARQTAVVVGPDWGVPLGADTRRSLATGRQARTERAA